MYATRHVIGKEPAVPHGRGRPDRLAGRSLRPPGLRSLGDVCAPASCLRWPSTPARREGRPLP